MRFFQINFILFFLLITSCSLPTTKGYIEQKKNIDFFKNTSFSDIKKDYIYKANINIYGYYFGGIIIIKKIAKNHHRVVFTTEFGNKIFDFEIKKNFQKNFILENLDKKFIINTLKRDFQILLQEDNKIFRFYTKKSTKIYQSLFYEGYNFYVVNKNSLKKIIYTTKRKEKIVFNFFDFEKNTPKKITINHKNIKLNINLNYIGN